MMYGYEGVFTAKVQENKNSFRITIPKDTVEECDIVGKQKITFKIIKIIDKEKNIIYGEGKQ